MSFFDGNARMQQQQHYIFSLEKELKQHQNAATAKLQELQRYNERLKGLEASAEEVERRNDEFARQVEGLRMRCASLVADRKKLLEEREANVKKVGVAMQNFHNEINMRRELQNTVAALKTAHAETKRELAAANETIEHLDNIKTIQQATQCEFREVSQELNTYLSSFRGLLVEQGIAADSANPEEIVTMIAQLVRSAREKDDELRRTKHKLSELSRIVENAHGTGGRVLRSSQRL